MSSEGPTSEEEAIVAEHFAWLQQHTDRGVMMLAGRALNTDESAFGVAICQAASVEEVQALMCRDPAVAPGGMHAGFLLFQVTRLHSEPA